MPSTSASQLASMMLSDTPTVPQLRWPSVETIRTRVFAAVASWPSRMRTVAFGDGQFRRAIDDEFHGRFADRRVSIAVLAEARVVFGEVERFAVLPEFAADQDFQRPAGGLERVAFVLEFLHPLEDGACFR